MGATDFFSAIDLCLLNSFLRQKECEVNPEMTHQQQGSTPTLTGSMERWVSFQLPQHEKVAEHPSMDLEVHKKAAFPVMGWAFLYHEWVFAFTWMWGHGCPEEEEGAWIWSAVFVCGGEGTGDLGYWHQSSGCFVRFSTGGLEGEE